jgi:hypothetical protein
MWLGLNLERRWQSEVDETEPHLVGRSKAAQRSLPAALLPRSKVQF